MVKPDGVQNTELSIMDEFQNQFAEQRVLPCEPCTSEVLRIVLVEGLMHKSGSGVSVHQHHYAVPYFIVISRGECPHHYAHRPDHIVTDMRAADSLSGSALEKIGITVA